MEPDPTTQSLLEALHEIPVVDAHEHLVPEAKRISRHVDFFILFSHYTRADFISAGMAPEMYQRLVDDEDMSVDKKWAAF